MADRLQRLAALENGESLLAVTFHTFFSLASEILGEGGEPGWRPVGAPLFFDRLVDSLLEGGPRRSRRTRGLAAAYRSSLRDLADSGVEPRAADLVGEGLFEEKEGGSLKDLLALLEDYERELSRRKILSPSSLTRRAAELASGSPVLRRFQAVLYYGFYDLTGLQADFFEAVAKERPTTLFFPYLKGHPAYSFADRLFETRLHMGGGAPEHLPPARGPRALGEAEDALFIPGHNAPVPEGALRLFTASGERDEAWRTAKEILLLHEEEGYAFSEIGVTARDLGPYRAALASALGDCAVPFHASTVEPLLRRPAARACRTLLTLARWGFAALSVAELTGSCFFKGKSRAGWPALIRRSGIHAGWLQWEGRLAPVPGEDAAGLWALLRRWKKALSPEGKRSWTHWAAYARGLVLEYLDAEGEPGFEEALQALEGLSVFDLLEKSASWDEFLDAAVEALSRAGTPLCSGPNLGVRVLDAMEARGESFRALFILGLRDGFFPRTIREDPLLRDSTRRKLRETGGYWVPAKLEGHDEERLLFHLLASSARERLYCSYPRSDEEGRAQAPSIFLLELLRAAGLSAAEGRYEHVPRQPYERLLGFEKKDALSPREAALAAALSGADPRALYEAMGWDAAERGRLSAGIRELGRSGAPGRMDGVIGPPVEYLAELRGRGLSPTALETLGRCPFQYFAGKVLGLEEEERPSSAREIAPSLRGTIYHRFLAAFYRRLGDRVPEGGSAFPDKAFSAVEREVFAEYGARALGIHPLLWEITRESLLGNLRAFLEWDLAECAASKMKPMLLEEAMEADFPAPRPQGLKDIKLTGVPDRIDAGEGFWRIVDYKTRWKRGALASLALKGRALQAPLYLELAAGRPRLAGLKAHGAFLLPVEDSPEGTGRPRSVGYTAAAHEENRTAVLAKVAALVEAAARGEFLIRPEEGEGGHCGFCPFPGVCRKNHPMTRIRASAA